MADVKFTDLPSATEAGDADVFPFVDTTADETKKITLADLRDAIGGGDVTNPLTADLDADGHRITGLGAPVDSGDAARIDDVRTMAEASSAATSITLEPSHVGKCLTTTAATGVTVTVPEDDIEVGALIYLCQGGAGQITVAPENVNVTVASSASLKSSGQHAMMMLWQRAANAWVLTGDRE